MAATKFFKVRVPPDVKRRVAVAAERKFLTESTWLRGLVMRELAAVEGITGEAETALMSAERASCQKQHKARSGACSSRVHIRLRPDDRLLLEARAAARGMRPATYISILARSHLRRLAPLPKDELLALRRSIGELAAIGRNINQIAKVANRDEGMQGWVRTDFQAMLRICEALRDNTKALLKVNLSSWEAGYPSSDNE